MSLAIRKAPDFITDFENLFSSYLNEMDERLAWQFTASLEISLTKLSIQPDLGRLRQFRNPNIRAVRSFAVTHPLESVLIFYRATSSSVDAFRLMDSTRSF
jgi:hypothetical protein